MTILVIKVERPFSLSSAAQQAWRSKSGPPAPAPLFLHSPTKMRFLVFLIQTAGSAVLGSGLCCITKLNSVFQGVNSTARRSLIPSTHFDEYTLTHLWTDTLASKRRAQHSR